MENMKSSEHFKLPDNFFNDFGAEIDAKIIGMSSAEKQINKIMPLNRSIKTIMSAAALICVLVVSAFFLISSQHNNLNSSAERLALSNEEYMELMLEDLDTDVIDDIIAKADYRY